MFLQNLLIFYKKYVSMFTNILYPKEVTADGKAKERDIGIR